MASNDDRPPLPDFLPGEFFVITWDRYAEKFILLVDDEERSSYDLGKNMNFIMRIMRRWAVEWLGSRAIDMAKEFGAAQAILGTDRVIALYERPSAGELLFKDGDEQRVFNLPALSGH